MSSPGWQWRAGGATVTGASHLRQNRENQDALRVFPSSGRAESAVVAIADGHGGTTSPRSETGAQIAVNLTIYMLRDRLGRLPLHGDFTGFAEKLTTRWRSAIESHAEPDPPSSHNEGVWSAYGTTLIFAAVGPAGLLLAQIGDGDILAVAEDGTVTRPIPPDDRLIGNMTTSLSGPKPVGDFRVRFLEPDDPLPALVVLSTDGYANSFRTDADFLQVGRDLLAMIRADGLDHVLSQLEGWLVETSAQGSGDDISVGILCRSETGPSPT